MKRGLDVVNLTEKRSDAFNLYVRHLSLASGRILCVAGPNGSGKTTLIECLSGLLTPQQGKITFDGISINANLKASKTVIGLIPDDETWFIKELCAKEYFALLEQVYRSAGVTVDMSARLTELAETLHFTAFFEPLEQLSHGNKKKVQIIAGLLHNPGLIILDELRNGLDPLASIAAERLIKTEAKRGACIVAATHDLWWAERMADEILLLVDGKPRIQNSIKKLLVAHKSIERAFLHTVTPHGSYAR